MLVFRRPLRYGYLGRRSRSGQRSRSSGVGWHHDLRGWRSIPERCLGPDRVVMTTPALDDDLGLAERVEDLSVEQLVPEAGVEAFDKAILPR